MVCESSVSFGLDCGTSGAEKCRNGSDMGRLGGGVSRAGRGFGMAVLVLHGRRVVHMCGGVKRGYGVNVCFRFLGCARNGTVTSPSYVVEEQMDVDCWDSTDLGLQGAAAFVSHQGRQHGKENRERGQSHPFPCES